METSPEQDDPMAEPLDMPEAEEPVHPSFIPKKPKKTGRKILLGLLLLVLFCSGAFAFWKLALDKKPENNQPASEEQQAAQQTPGNSDNPESAKLKTYESALLNLSLSYPDSWQVAEKDGGVTLTSPMFTYDSLLGENDGNFKVYIRQGSRSSDSKYIGQAVVVKPTQIIQYDSPALGQRKKTNLSFFGYGDSENFAFFMITGNFILKKGDTLGPDYAKEPDAFIIAGGYSDSTLENDLEFNKMDPATFDSTNAYKQAVDIIKSLQLR